MFSRNAIQTKMKFAVCMGKWPQCFFFFLICSSRPRICPRICHFIFPSSLKSSYVKTFVLAKLKCYWVSSMKNIPSNRLHFLKTPTFQNRYVAKSGGKNLPTLYFTSNWTVLIKIRLCLLNSSIRVMFKLKNKLRN